jgi:integrase
MPKAEAPKRQYGNGTIYSLHPTNPNKPPFEGYIRKVIDGKRYSSPKFRGDMNKGQVQNQIKAWLQGGGFENLVAPKTNTGETVGDFLQAWFDSKLDTWKPKTRETNSKNFNKHVKGNTIFWNTILKDVDLNTVDAFLASMTGSQNTKYNVLRLIRPAFTRAVNRDKLKSNPFLRLESDAKPKKSKSRVVCFSDKDERNLIQFATAPGCSPLWRALILFGLDAGAEPQEFHGLQWSDIRKGRVYFHRTVVVVESKVIVQEGADAMKADNRARDFRLAPSTLRALEALREAATGHSGDSDFIFSPDGRPWHYHRFHDAWTAFLKRAGVSKHYPPLAMRHTMASQMLSAGEALPAVSARLGHGDINTTLKHYVQFIPTDFEKLADASEARFARLIGSQQFTPVRQHGSLNGSLGENQQAA